MGVAHRSSVMLYLGWRLADAITREDLVRHRVAEHVEPAPAALRMHPALAVHAFGIATHEEIVRPLGIGERVGVFRPSNMCLAAAAELDLVARSAPGAGDQQHAGLNAPRRRRRARR